MLYIDNPVGAGQVTPSEDVLTLFMLLVYAGFSFSDKLPTTNDDVTDNLYEFLQQWFQLFPEYQVSLHNTNIPILLIDIFRKILSLHLENPMLESLCLPL